MPANLTDIAPTKDRAPKMRGSARAYAMLEQSLRLDLRLDAQGAPCRPMIHQADGLACMMDRLERFSSFGLLHDMGCGKTLTVLAMLMQLHAERRATSMLVVCPSSVIGSWQLEVESLNTRHGREVVEVLGLSQDGVAKREAALTRRLLERDAREAGGEKLPPLLVAMNYEATHRMEGTLRAARFDIDVCDESQRIKGHNSKQSFAMGRLGKLAPFRIIMTGTPVPEGGLDWFGQFRFADHELLGSSYGNFKARFAVEFDMPGSNGKKFRKVKLNPHTAAELEGMVMERVHRVSKQEAVDLPPVTATELRFDLTTRGRRIYDDLVRNSIALIERGGMNFDLSDEFGEVLGDNPLLLMLRCQQICGGYVQVDGAGHVEPVDPRKNPKLSALLELAEDLRDTGKKLVVFHRFAHEGEAIHHALQRLSGTQRPVSVINGSVKTSDRKEQVAQFQDGDTIFFVGQIQAAAEGITLNAASDLAHYSLPFGSAPYQQGNSRVDRIGQVNPVTLHHLIANDTLDESLYATQQRKLDAAIEATDGAWGRFMRGEFAQAWRPR